MPPGSTPAGHWFEVMHAGRPVRATEMGTQEPAIILLSGLVDPAFWWFQGPAPAQARPHWPGNADTLRAGRTPALAMAARVAAYDRAGVGDTRPPTMTAPGPMSTPNWTP